MTLKLHHLIFIALILRLLPLNQSLWLDEAINVTAARDRGVVDLITNYSIADFHPPLYHPILHYWIKILGDSEIAVRLPSVIFGLITLYYIHKISTLVIKPKSISLGFIHLDLQLLPATFLSLSGLHIYYSGEARMYSLAAMFVSASFYYLLKSHPPNQKIKSTSPHSILKTRLTQQTPTPPLVISLIGLLYTDYVAWLTLPVFLWYNPISTLVAILFLIPWLPLFWQQLNLGLGQASLYPAWNQLVGGFSLKNILLIPIKFTLGRVSFPTPFIYALLVIPILVLLSWLIVLALRHKQSLQKQIIKLWLIIPITLGIILSFKISILSYFRFLFLLPAFYLLITLGLSQLSNKLQQAAALTLIIITLSSTLVYLANPTFHREDWRGLVSWMDTNASPTSIAIFPSLNQAAAFDYYQPQTPAYESIRQVSFKPDQVFLLRYVQEIFDPEDQARVELENLGYTLSSQHYFNGVVVWLYIPGEKLFAHAHTSNLTSPN